MTRSIYIFKEPLLPKQKLSIVLWQDGPPRACREETGQERGNKWENGAVGLKRWTGELTLLISTPPPLGGCRAPCTEGKKACLIWLLLRLCWLSYCSRMSFLSTSKNSILNEQYSFFHYFLSGYFNVDLVQSTLFWKVGICLFRGNQNEYVSPNEGEWKI